jgi:hypothetical protein
MNPINVMIQKSKNILCKKDKVMKRLLKKKKTTYDQSINNHYNYVL